MHGVVFQDSLGARVWHRIPDGRGTEHFSQRFFRRTAVAIDSGKVRGSSTDLI